MKVRYPRLDSEAVDFRAASFESFAPARTLTRRNLQTLRLLTSSPAHQGRLVPGRSAASLLFGTDRLAHFPDAWIQAGRFAGIDKATILDHLDIKTPLMQAVDPSNRVLVARLHRACRTVVDARRT